MKKILFIFIFLFSFVPIFNASATISYYVQFKINSAKVANGTDGTDFCLPAGTIMTIDGDGLTNPVSKETVNEVCSKTYKPSAEDTITSDAIAIVTGHTYDVGLSISHYCPGNGKFMSIANGPNNAFSGCKYITPNDKSCYDICSENGLTLYSLIDDPGSGYVDHITSNMTSYCDDQYRNSDGNPDCSVFSLFNGYTCTSCDSISPFVYYNSGTCSSGTDFPLGPDTIALYIPDDYPGRVDYKMTRLCQLKPHVNDLICSCSYLAGAFDFTFTP